jgi:hypothetical protein
MMLADSICAATCEIAPLLLTAVNSVRAVYIHVLFHIVVCLRSERKYTKTN